MKKVLLIYGGVSTEHEISVSSAKTILSNIDKTKYLIDTIYITKENIWLNNNKKINNIIEFIKQYDIVFPIIHGNNGEDGKIQGMLDLFNIKYVGSKCGSSYICMDKIRTKEILSNYNIPMLKYDIYNSENNIILDYPIIIKPANGGSSIGINIANNKEELNKYINEALKYDKKILLEEYIESPTELECACLKINGNLIVLIGSIDHDSTFYDYNSKYNNKKTCTNLNPNISNDVKNKLINYSKKIFNVLELDGLARIDFFLHNNNIYLNEINTLPGFTNISIYPSIFSNIGINIKELITLLLENI